MTLILFCVLCMGAWERMCCACERRMSASFCVGVDLRAVYVYVRGCWLWYRNFGLFFFRIVTIFPYHCLWHTILFLWRCIYCTNSMPHHSKQPTTTAIMHNTMPIFWFLFWLFFYNKDLLIDSYVLSYLPYFKSLDWPS